MSFDRRANLTELMDDADLPVQKVAEALDSLAVLNRLTAARRILARECRGERVLDVATGGADIAQYLAERGRARLVVGLDRQRSVLRAARGRGRTVPLVLGDGRRMPFARGAFNTAFCHLLAHHLDPEDLSAVLREMGRVAKRVVVLDLCRDPRLHAAVWLLTRFSRSPVARHDGPVSVRRAYTSREAAALGSRAGLPVSVRRVPGWRWLLVAETASAWSGGQGPTLLESPA